MMDGFMLRILKLELFFKEFKATPVKISIRPRPRVYINEISDDVNAVCFVDESSNVIVSGSDDTFLKVWDRRSVSAGQTGSSGVFLGHTEGVTYVASKNDSRFCLSNSKDQSMKMVSWVYIFLKTSLELFI
jgi:WD40 repeat protein